MAITKYFWSRLSPAFSCNLSLVLLFMKHESRIETQSYRSSYLSSNTVLYPPCHRLQSLLLFTLPLQATSSSVCHRQLYQCGPSSQAGLSSSATHMMTTYSWITVFHHDLGSICLVPYRGLASIEVVYTEEETPEPDDDI